MTKQKQSPDTDTDTDTDTDAQRTSRRGVTTVITLTLVVGVVLAASISPLGVVAAATEFSVNTTAPETVSPDETIDITYTIENTGDTALESLALSGTPQTSDTELTITDAASDSAATITEDNRIIFETVAPGASVTATLTVAVGTDATGTESLTAETTNGFGQNEVSKQTVTEFTVTTETPTPPNFEVSDLEPQDATVNVNEAFDVSATIENTGNLQGEQEMELRVGGDAVRTQTVSLDTGVTTTVTFNSVTVDTAGEFTQTVASANDSVTGSLTVEEAAEDDFSVTTAAPETVTPDETIDITYTIENTGDTTLESLALSGTPQTSDTDLTITDATSDDAATIPADNRVIFETVEPAASVTATLTVVVGSDATGTESLTAETTNGFGQNEVSKQTVTEFTVTTENTPPSADAGTNQTVDEESQVALDGTGSSAPESDSDSGPPAPPGFSDSLSYRWTQTGGPSVSLQDSATPTPEFTAPSVTSDTTLTFELTVTDGNGGQDTDTVAIVVEPQQGQINVTRQVSSTEVSPGGEVTLTTEVSGVSGSDSVSITSSYDPALDSAPTGSVAVDDGALSPSNIDADASPTGSTLTVSNLDTTTDSGSVTVTVTETLTGAEEAGVTHSITGSVTAGDTQIDVDPVEVRVTDPEDESTIDVTRTVSADEVAPNDQVTVTTEMTGVSGTVSTTSSYDPQVASATVQSVTVNGASASPIIATGQSGGSVVTLGDVGTGTDATVRITEELTVGEQTDVTHEITGEVTAGETSTEVDPVSVTVAEPQSVVDEYDTDNDGTISITELGAAGADFASGELTITELGRIGAEFAS